MSNRTTHVALVVDHSISMRLQGVDRQVGLTNGIVNQLRRTQGSEGRTLVTEVRFGRRPKLHQQAASLKGYPKAKSFDGTVDQDRTGTALWAAMLAGFEAMRPYDNRAANIAFLMIVVTDGRNNQDLHLEPELKAAIARAQNSGQWTIVYLTVERAPDIGIEQDNIHRYHDLNKLLAAGKKAVSKYMQAREVGRQAVDDLLAQ